MKHIFLLLLIATTSCAFAQITTDSVKGTWVDTVYYGRVQKLIITNDSVTVVVPYRTAPGSNEWKTSTYSGSYTIEKGNKLHVIFNDNPPEEAYYKVERDKDSVLHIVTGAGDKKKKVIYSRE